MRILLVQPPVDYSVPRAFHTEGLGIAYIASVLRRDGHEVELLDAHTSCLSLDATIHEILSRNFQVLGITSADNHRNALITIVSAVRSHRKDATICAGGYLPTLSHEQLLRACPKLDFVVRGEGELTVSEVFRRIEANEDWHDVSGIAYLKGDEICTNSMPPLIDDLDSLPFPARDALLQAAPGVAKSAGVATSRGCYHNCSFCCISAFYGLHERRAPRFRDPVKVVDEIEDVIRTTGLREIRFIDDDFIGPGEKSWARAQTIAQEIIDRRVDINFRLECRADEVHEETLKLLKDAGLTEVFLGIESMVPRALQTFNKQTTVEQNLAAIELVRRLGIKLRIGYIMFDPYLTVEELQEHLKIIKTLGFDREAQDGPAPFVTRLNVFRGTPLADKLSEDGLLIDDGFKLDYRYREPLIGLLFRGAILMGRVSSTINRFTKRK